jgi:hypothetical protein
MSFTRNVLAVCMILGVSVSSQAKSQEKPTPSKSDNLEAVGKRVAKIEAQVDYLLKLIRSPRYIEIDSPPELKAAIKANPIPPKPETLETIEKRLAKIEGQLEQLQKDIKAQPPKGKLALEASLTQFDTAEAKNVLQALKALYGKRPGFKVEYLERMGALIIVGDKETVQNALEIKDKFTEYLKKANTKQ